MRSLERTTEWLAGDGRWAEVVLRLFALAVASASFASMRGKGVLDLESLFFGLAAALVFAAPFALWRLVDERRKARLRRERAVPPLQLD